MGGFLQSAGLNPYRYLTGSGLWYAAPDQGNGVLLDPQDGRVRTGIVPFGAATPIAAIGAEVTTIGSAGALVRLGIYADTGSGMPGALVVDAGTFDGTVLGVSTLPTAGLILPAGMYHFAVVPQGAPVTAPTLRVGVTLTGFPIGATTPAAASLSTPNNSYLRTGVPGALPAAFGAATATSNAHRAIFQVP